MKTVIYHSADYDGIFCREIAKHFLGDKDVNYIGWNFGDAPLQIPDSGTIYVLDLPLDVTFGGKPGEFNLGVISAVDGNRLFWIDHHASAIKTHPTETGGYRIDGVAACRLAWQWFLPNTTRNPMLPHEAGGLPGKQDFIDRKVSEPLAVRLAGEYDIWDHRGDGDLELQFGLRCVDSPDWKMLLNPYSTQITDMYISQGKVAMAYSIHVDADLVTHRSYRMDWEGLNFIVLNTGRFNSLTFAALDKPETGHDALLGYMFNGKCWTVSLYHAKHRTDIDLSLIAVKHGGGGHRGACGFTCQKLPFP